MNPERLAQTFLVIWLTGLTACTSGRPGLPVGPLRTPPSRPTPTFDCTQDPPGLSLRIIEISDRADSTVTPARPASLHQLRVEGQGFLPGEDVRISIVAVVGGGLSGGGQGGSMKVGADGSLVWGPVSMTAETTVEWVVSVVHQRGVACASTTTGR